MTTIRSGISPTPGLTAQTPVSERQSASTPTSTPKGWDQFQDAFSSAPATAIENLRQRANELGRPDVVAPLSGLQVTDNGHHSVASNTLRNYPVKEIFSELYTDQAPAQDSGWKDFQSKFYATPGTALTELRNKAQEIGRPELVDGLAGLMIEDGGHHSAASNAMRNYPIQKIYESVFGNS